MADIFISYSTLNKDKAAKLAQRLRDAGFLIWMDEANLHAASKWSSEIVRAIEECKVFIILLSPDSFDSHNVIKELSLASEGKKQIIPIELDPSIELTHEVKYQLAGIQRVTYSEYDRIESAIRRFLFPDAPEHVSSSKPAKKRSPILRYAFGILIAGLATGAYILLSGKHETPQQTVPQLATPLQAAPAVTVKKLVVLPFESLSKDKENDFSADGLTAQVITSLSGLPGFQIVDLKTAMNYKGRNGDRAAVAKELGARYVVDGTVQKHGKNLKITSQLIDADTGKVLLADQFDGTTDDLLGLEAKLTRSITSELQGSSSQKTTVDSATPRRSSPRPPKPPKSRGGRDFDRIYPGSN